MDFAQDEARLLGHDVIGTEHLLLGLVRESDGVAGQVLCGFGVTLSAARQDVEQISGVNHCPPGRFLPLTPRARLVLELSLAEAAQLGRTRIGTEHLLLGLIREARGVAPQVLVRLHADPALVRAKVLEALTTIGEGGTVP
jgi:ATP-dependent Clp protease ATP-binding subunit ClpC